MKLRLALVVSAIVVLNVLGSGIVSAADPHAVPLVPPATQHAPTFSAHCSGAHPDGIIRVWARVRHAVHGKTLTGTASAVLTGGPAAVNLHRRGNSYRLAGKLSVPSTQPVGPVTVTVSITYDGQTTILTCTSAIHLPKLVHPVHP